jgi:antitoxin Phd
MLINTDKIVSMTQANQNFSSVARLADRLGDIVIFKNNRPKYVLIDIEDNLAYYELSDDEKIDIVARRILKKYLPAFQELAK